MRWRRWGPNTQSTRPRCHPFRIREAGRVRGALKAPERAREELLVKEKDMTRARDALAAERRRMPRMALEKDYRFKEPDGPVGLLDLFEGRRQLLLYRAFCEPGVAASSARQHRRPGVMGASRFSTRLSLRRTYHARVGLLLPRAGVEVRPFARGR